MHLSIMNKSRFSSSNSFSRCHIQLVILDECDILNSNLMQNDKISPEMPETTGWIPTY